MGKSTTPKSRVAQVTKKGEAARIMQAADVFSCPCFAIIFSPAITFNYRYGYTYSKYSRDCWVSGLGAVSHSRRPYMA